MRQMVRGITKTEDCFDVIQEEQTESQHKRGDVPIIADASLNAANRSAHRCPQEDTSVVRLTRAWCSVGLTALE